VGASSATLVPFVPRSKSILEHLQECKRENNERLKQVRNLDDLVMLKLTTVADKIKQEHAGKGVEILGLDMFQKLCDPLLVNSANYHSVTKKSYLVNSKPGGLKVGGGATSKNLDSSFISEMGSPRVNRRGSTLMTKDNLNQPSALGFLGEPLILNQETTESTQRIADARR
jgi:hypothetical protein